MYIGLLHFHNFGRWLVLVAGVVALVLIVLGLVRRQPWTKRERIAGVAFMGLLDLQLVIGILLYVVSPIVQTALGNMSAAMGDSTLRFFAVEHAAFMVAAVVSAHVGTVAVRRAAEDGLKYRRALTWYGLAFVLVILGIPWWRPLFPGM